VLRLLLQGGHHLRGLRRGRRRPDRVPARRRRPPRRRAARVLPAPRDDPALLRPPPLAPRRRSARVAAVHDRAHGDRGRGVGAVGRPPRGRRLPRDLAVPRPGRVPRRARPARLAGHRRLARGGGGRGRRGGACPRPRAGGGDRAGRRLRPHPRRPRRPRRRPRQRGPVHAARSGRGGRHRRGRPRGGLRRGAGGGVRRRGGRRADASAAVRPDPLVRPVHAPRRRPDRRREAAGGRAVPPLPLLSALWLTPLVGALVVVVLPGAARRAARPVALATSVLVLGLAVALALGFDPGGDPHQFVESHPWIPAFGATYTLGLDGLAL